MKIVKNIAAFFGLEVIRSSTLNRLLAMEKLNNSWKLGLRDSVFNGLEGFKFIPPVPFQSQLGQDYLATVLFGSSGFFVEFGATNGVELSNTYALEKMGWQGILAEPSKKWHDQLRVNRPNTSISFECVWTHSNEKLEFSEASSGVLSTLSQFVKSDHHNRQIAEEYSVNTISLQDLLDERKAPRFVEFLSIDTEGSELEILSAFNWEERSFGFIAVEHNYTEKREEIFKFLSSKGYTRVLEEHSKWDDWYIHESLKLGVK
jgi:FkbM family methyltransferase